MTETEYQNCWLGFRRAHPSVALLNWTACSVEQKASFRQGCDVMTRGIVVTARTPADLEQTWKDVVAAQDAARLARTMIVPLGR